MFVMSTQKQTNVIIAGRLAELVAEKTDGNAKKFARLAEIGSVTFYNYLKGRGCPAHVLANICESFGVNLNWLIVGIGPKYITNQGEAGPLDPDPEIAELMEGARRVLSSGNPIAFDALERNIKYFDHAIAAEKELQGMKDDVADIKRELAQLKKKKSDSETSPKEERSPDEKAA